MVECENNYRLSRFLRTGFQAPESPDRTRFSTYDVELAPGTDMGSLLLFFREELGIKSMPTLIAEIDGEQLLRIFQEAENRGMVLLSKRVCGATIVPL
jgi:hypothetical protein